ncbi:WcaI family glycosyltransferase [Dyadobacter chenhuakuii]|uniref:WcaI family glycosyltransferase n=1 Tax=Dyadobacter chenhuakuii TaxID=2909339 RepID=A0ABY4XM46_9BACT|nr:WcaI family glycosyltransferase [Dyadobacter chenhuakuii]MCF2494189.1 WcaI family glycosyltransferase [Dyadobacter chenhuakuii]USJ31316.1 WcaI family glycosyltransferase [Dyadobacter chenhuakuii]
MRILIYGINYAPELTGIGKYTGEMASWLADKKHNVSVITAVPYYPEWNIHDNYKNTFWKKETIKGVEVYRCPLYVPKKITSLTRIIHEFSFLISSLPIWLKLLFAKKYDIVICVSPPFHLGFMALIYSKLKNSKLVIHVQDLQIDAAKELGMIRNPWLLKVMFQLESFLLKSCSAISTISPGMRRKILLKGFPSSKIMLFANWVDEKVVHPVSKENSLRKQFGIELDDKVILYSGNLGEKQGLELIIETAALYKNRSDIKFLIVGSGGGKLKLETMVAELNVTNVSFLPLQPIEQLSALLATADLHLVLQKKSASDLVMPSKLTGILAAGGCAIVTAFPNTSLYDTVKRNNLGILIEPESVAALKNGIDLALTSDLTIYRTNARRYAEDVLTKDKILQSFEDKLIHLIQTSHVLSQVQTERA